MAKISTTAKKVLKGAAVVTGLGLIGSGLLSTVRNRAPAVVGNLVARVQNFASNGL